MADLEFSGEKISCLRKSVEELMSGFRLRHTLGVEEMAARIGQIYCPEKENVLRAAALLHDITKELAKDEQVALCKKHGYEPAAEELAAPATLHSLTAAMVIPEKYSCFADEEILSAVRYHTTGRENMSLCEKIIYLADYIEDGRDYDDCVALRNEFWGADIKGMNECEKAEHLDRVILHSFDLTLSELIQKGRVISPETVKARNYLVLGQIPSK